MAHTPTLVHAPLKADASREVRSRLRADLEGLTSVRGTQATAELVLRALLDAGRYVVRHPLPGRSDRETLEAVIRGSQEGGELVIGARYDENPCAVTSLLALARALGGRRFSHTVRLVAYAHDTGSRAYARRLREQATDLRGMLSLDSVGHGTFVAFVGESSTRDFVGAAQRAFGMGTRLEARMLLLPSVVPLMSSSEHRAFSEEGYCAALVTDSVPLRSRRRPDQINCDVMAEVVSGLASVVARLAGESD